MRPAAFTFARRIGFIGAIACAASLAAGHLTLVPDLAAALEKEGRGDIMIVVGGVIPPADYPALFAAGAKAVFGPGTNIPRAAADLLDKLNAELGYSPKVAAE